MSRSSAAGGSTSKATATLGQVQPTDLIRYGLIPEFVGRLPVIGTLHDLDKPLLYRREGTGAVHTPLYHELPHGVIGAMMLKELGFPHTVVSTVATHATNAPFHGSTHEAYVLHYADMFAADHAMLQMGRQPFYQRKH